VVTTSGGGGGSSTGSNNNSPIPSHSPPVTASSFESMFKNGLNMHTMQLELLARTGMLYHRFPELAGNYIKVRDHNSCFFSYWH
jgi:hypothetical protein